MNRKMTRWALAGKCGFLGASGSAARDSVSAVSFPSSASKGASAIVPEPAPALRRKARRLVGGGGPGGWGGGGGGGGGRGGGLFLLPGWGRGGLRERPGGLPEQTALSGVGRSGRSRAPARRGQSKYTNSFTFNSARHSSVIGE